ncbi:MAG: lipoprotein insertase outer membrane protein LolB [Oleiphilaceae bacterium]|nr:lipoprotein insertase outer membrane protein LolB [Oleiphilaceae bacterium]
MPLVPSPLRARRLLPLLVLAALIQGCVSAPPPPDQDHSRTRPDDWPQRQEQRTAFDEWTLQGKIAVRQSDRNDTGVVREWQQSGEAFDLTVSSSFMGMGTTRLTGTPEFLVITTPDGKKLVSQDPEALIREALGWELPIASLAYWVRGVPAPGADYELYFDDQGQLGYVLQSGWEIYYENYAPLEEDQDGSASSRAMELPRRMTASHEDALVRLVVTQWQGAD